MDPAFIELVKVLGIPLAMCFLIAISGAREEKPGWVFGHQYRDVKAQRDKKEAQIDRLIELGFKAATLAETQAKSISDPTKGKTGE